MAFEQVTLRLANGQEFGPVTMPELLHWHREGRVPPDATLVDALSGETRAVADFPALIIAPPPLPGTPAFAAMSTGGSNSLNRIIPTGNPNALIGYYCGIFGLLCAPVLGPVALILGILGMRDVKKTNVGFGHALTGIIMGSIESSVSLVLLVLMFIGMATS